MTANNETTTPRASGIMKLVSKALMDSSLNYEQSRALLERAANGIEELETDLTAALARAEMAEAHLKMPADLNPETAAHVPEVYT